MLLSIVVLLCVTARPHCRADQGCVCSAALNFLTLFRARVMPDHEQMSGADTVCRRAINCASTNRERGGLAGYARGLALAADGDEVGVGRLVNQVRDELRRHGLVAGEADQLAQQV